MARKKKSKKSKKADGEKKLPAEVTAPEVSKDEGEKPAAEKARPKPKKKRARKKAEKKAEATKAEKADKAEGDARKEGGTRKGGPKKGRAASAGAEPPEDQRPAPAPTAEEATRNVDHSASETADVEAQVAEVAVLDEVKAGERAAVPVEEPEQDAVPIEDIDAVLDDDENDDLATLIAQAVAGAESEDHPADEPVESLDDGLVPAEPAGMAEVEEAATPPSSAAAVGTAEPVAAAPEEPEEEVDLTGAIDLGPEITQELRDRLLAQALAHAELQDARYRVPYADPRPTGRWKALVAAGLVLVAGILAAAPPSWVRPDPPAQLDAAGRARALRTALLLQSQQVDAYRVRYQQLPESLDDLPHSIPGLRYVRSGSRAYQIIGYERDGNAVIYDSSNPSPEFGRLARSFEPGAAP